MLETSGSDRRHRRDGQSGNGVEPPLLIGELTAREAT